MNWWATASYVIALASFAFAVLDASAQSGDTLFGWRPALMDKGFAREKICTAALVAVRGLREAGKVPEHVWFWVDTFDVHMPWGHASKRIRTGVVSAG